MDVQNATDILYDAGQEETFVSKRIKGGEKHGSGCVLSMALLVYLAKGMELRRACRSAKSYTRLYLESTETLIGYHSTI